MTSNSELALKVDSLINVAAAAPISSNSYVAMNLLGRNLHSDRQEGMDYAGTLYNTVDMPAR